MQNGYVAKNLSLPPAGQFLPAIWEHPQHNAKFFGAWTWEGGMYYPQSLCHTGLQLISGSLKNDWLTP